MPTRLLELYKTDDGRIKLRLVLSQNLQTSSYCALSYCWGEDEGAATTRTTKGTMEAFQAGIPIDVLPKTIEHAVVVTYKLNLRYMWIDSLCIIQDSRKDKRREIAQMPLIYGEAALVIAASRAKSAVDGFLKPRKQLGHVEGHIEFELPFRRFDNEEGAVVLRDTRYERDGGTEPLDTRAWAMQERLLATRIVEYGTLQTRWTCLENRRGYRDGWVEGEQFGWGRYNLSETRLFPAPGHTQEDLSLSSLPVAVDWYTLLWHYTHRNLTVKSDRLLAISGIVQEFSKASGEEYLAGLWKTLLPDDLLWNIQKGRRQPRPVEYQAPSWSWAAVNGPVFPRLDDEVGKESCLQVKEIEVTPEEADLPHGAISYGRIVVRGKCKPAKWNPQPLPGKSRLRQTRASTFDRPNSTGTATRPLDTLPLNVLDDCIEDEATCASWVPVTLLLGRCDDQACPDGYSGLVLKQRQETTFARVGKFIFKRPDRNDAAQDVWHDDEDWRPWATWFDDASWQEMAIE
jgi:hypothetical protein